ncbi:hypothetical protein GCM10023185_39350 [Hymenobacter saemangeumensis]|uniref:Uncharacterized protein n=1 Tax=Hymenobacter saemangeumensis TaxID=1084522 RepID=A0ABP8IRD4_9BACT
MDALQLAKLTGFFHNATLDAVSNDPDFESITNEQSFNVAMENAAELETALVRWSS